MPDNLTTREVLLWVDAVIGHPIVYTAGRLGIPRTTAHYARKNLLIKLRCKDVASLIRHTYAIIGTKGHHA